MISDKQNIAAQQEDDRRNNRRKKMKESDSQLNCNCTQEMNINS